MIHPAPKSDPGIIKPPGETIHKNRVQAPVDHVLDLPHHASETRRRQPTLEYRELDALSILLADLSNPSESIGTLTVRVGNILGDEDVH